MLKHLTLFCFLLISAFSFGQNITLKGKVLDSENLPLESATIYITSAKDSSVIDYTISNKSGNWEIKTRKLNEPVFLKISYVSFTDYKLELPSAAEDKDFGVVKMEDQPTQMGEIVIKGEIPPIRIKQDTLEFNASSFKVRPDSNVQALLKQLPGVEVDTEGKITVNGKEVNQVLVNGKPFFDKDGKIALQNLPSEIIDKVQVTDTKTKSEELSGQKASGNEASINLTIQEDKNKGLFGKFMGGYGSDRRYESSGLINYFKGKRKISILGSSNNINTTGFSMNEIFDSMGGGRNSSVYMNSDSGSFGINGMQFGGGQGITQSNIFGLNYADELYKGYDASGSYFYTSANSENANRTSQLSLLPNVEDPDNPGTFIDNSFTTESQSTTTNDKFAHNFNTNFEFKIDSTSSLYFSPKFVLANSKVKSTSSQFSADENSELLNKSDAYTFDENDNKNFSNEIYYYKSFRRKGRSISASFNNSNSKDDGTNLNKSTTVFYEDSDNDGLTDTRVDARDQIRYNRQTRDNYNGSFEYLEPVMDSLRMKVGLNYKLEKSVEDREGFNFDTATGGYTALNDLLTNYLTSKTNTVTPNAGINIEKNKIYASVEAGTGITQFDNFSRYLGNDYTLNKTYLLPWAHANVSLQFSKSSSIWASYNYETDFPQAREVLPVADISNPLYTQVGNPDLNPNKYHNFYFSFRDYDYATRSGYSLYAGGNYYDSQVISSTTIDESAKRNTTYENVSGTYVSWFGFNLSKSIKKEAHTFKFNVGLGANYNFSKGFTNGQLYDAKTIRLSPRASFTWDYGEILSINPTYNFSYNDYSYTNYAISSASNFVHRFNLQTTSYWPKHFVFGNDFGYTYNSQIADGFKKDFYLWNTSLGYNFLKDRMLFKVKVYDVLNQNIGTSRTITPTTIRTEENIVLKRYIMFSLTFKLDKFGSKKKDNDDGMFWW
jgi:hypothetical protein